MRRNYLYQTLFLLAFIFSPFFISSVLGQEICNNGIDDDGNGLIDCNDPQCQYAPTIERGCNCGDGVDNDSDGLTDITDPECASYYGLTFVTDDADCSIYPPDSLNTFDFVDTPGQSQQNTVDTQSKMAIGDLDGDGIPEVIATSKWGKAVRVISSGGDGVTDPGEILDEFGTTGGDDIFPMGSYVYELELAIADIDGDGEGEIFAFASQRKTPNSKPDEYFMVALTYHNGQLEPLYDAVDVGPYRPGMIEIADFDGDGLSEIYFKNEIYAAETGALLAKGTGDWDTEVNSAPVAVDILPGTPNLELVSGNIIYNVPDLSDRNPSTPATLTVAKDLNDLGAQFYPKELFDPVEYGVTNYSSTSVADMNGDGNLDVVLSGAVGSPNGNTAIFFWDVANDTYSVYEPPDPVYPGGWPWGTSRPNLGDANGDGQMDILFIAGNQLFALTLDSGGNLVPLWPTPRIINDSRSGIVAVTIFDFDNDGNPEVVYRDSQQLVIVDGATGQNVLWSTVCQSHTMTEGPIIADVNGDGGTDICVPCYTSMQSFNINAQLQQQALGGLRIYFSSENLWLPTRKVWNQAGYFVVNINDDLTVPKEQFDQGTVFGTDPCSNGIPGPIRPFNIFLNQAPTIGPNGCPVYPAPDIDFVGDNPNANPGDPDYKDPNDPSYFPAVNVIPPICGDLGIEVEFNIINDGDLGINGTVPVSFWDGDPTVDPVPATPATLLYQTDLILNNFEVGDTMRIRGVTFNSTGKAFRLYIVLNDDGTVLPAGTEASSGDITECKLYNNTYYFDITPDPFDVTIDKIQDNIKCEDSAPDNGELKAVVSKNGVEVTDYSSFAFQWYTGIGTSNPIPGPAGTANVLTDLPEGDYSLVVTNTEKGCASNPTDTSIVRIGVDPEITIVENSPQTQCNPPNGELEVFITGGNAGFTFEWFDRFLNPIGITGSVASNLLAGEYVVSVFKDGCTKTGSQTVKPPVVPIVTANVLQHVVDCSNLNSGKLTAEASINGVPQDSANYSFYWYEWDTVASTLGSILAPTHGSGPTRWGLPPGEYAVVAQDDNTECESTPPVRVVIEDQTQIPDIVISEVAPQTSCDPANPNGILKADGYINGILQDPSVLTFEWFEGDNTLPSNLITTVSGVNGEIAEGIADSGLPYTVKITTGNNCFRIKMNTSLSENLEIPVVAGSTIDNSVCDPALAAGGSYTGQVQTSPTLNGSPISDFSDYTFTWYDGTDPNNDPVIPNTSPDGDILDGLDAGNYTVILERNSTSCVSNPVTFEIFNAIVPPVISVNETPATNCLAGIPNGQLAAQIDEGGSFTVNGYTFDWFKGVDTSPSGTPVSTVSGSRDEVAGQLWGDSTYTVLVINETTGCSNSLSQVVTNDSQIPQLSLSRTDNTICDSSLVTVPGYSGFVNATVTDRGVPVSDFANYTFEWFNGSSTSDPVLNNTNPDGDQLQRVPGGFYTARITNDSLGCASDPLTIEVLDNLTVPVITGNATPSSNCDPALANGSVEVTDVDGAGVGNPYIFEWHDGSGTSGPVVATTPAYTNLQGGPTTFFTVEVTNESSGCRNTFTLQVVDNRELPVLSLTSIPNTICDASLTNPLIPYDGSVTAVITNQTGAIDDYKFTWTDDESSAVIAGETGPDLLNRDSSSYTATVLHTPTGCVSVPESILVSANFDLPTITTTSVPSTNCDPLLANGQAEVTDVDGTGTGIPYVYLWHDGMNTSTPLAGETNPLLENLQGGASAFFTVLVTNENTGCQNTATELVQDQRIIPQFTLAATPNTICDPSSTNPATTYDGSVAATITNQGANPITDYEFTWTDEETGAVVFGPVTGGGGTNGENLTERDSSLYSLVIEQPSTGCISASSSVEVKANFFIPVIDVVSTPQTSCDPANPNGALAATIDESSIGGGSGINAGYVFQWHETSSVSGPDVTTTTGINGEVIQLAGNTNYAVLVTRDLTGCKNTKSVFLNENIVIPTATLTPTPQTYCSPPDGEILAVADPVPSQTYTFYWLKEDAFATTTDPAVVIADVSGSPAVPNRLFTGPVNGDTDTHTGLSYGDYTLVIVDDYTSCISETMTTHVDDDANSDIQFSPSVSPSSCATSDGVVQLQASRLDGRATDFTFDLYLGGPTNPVTPIDFYSNPPVFDAALNDGITPQPTITFPQNLGPVASGTNVTRDKLASNMYSVVITDDFGCQNLETFFLPFIDAHDIDAITSNSQICPYTIGDGSISVRAIPPTTIPDANQTQFTFRFYKGGVADPANLIPAPVVATDPFISGPEICGNGIDDDGDGLIDGADDECQVPNIPYSSDYTWPVSIEKCGSGIDEDGDGLTDAADPDCFRYLSARNLSPGIYTVEIQENISANNCKVYKLIEIEREALDPVISLVEKSPNTACDPAAYDGQLTFNVDKNADDLVPGVTYDIDVTYPPGPVSVTNPAYPVSGQPAGDYDALDLEPNTYTVNVTASTGCTATKNFTILNVPAIVTPSANIIDAEYCDPVLEASARIELLNLQVSGKSEVCGNGLDDDGDGLVDSADPDCNDNVEDYTFEWYTDAGLTQVIQPSSPGVDVGDGGEVLTNNGSPNPGMYVTNGPYYVVATKVLPGNTGGVGCVSAPFKADVGDKTVNPEVTLKPFGDTSCDGINFEGSIEITAATPSLGLIAPYTNPGSAGTYEYIWSPANPIAIGNSVNNNGNAVNDGDADVSSSLSPGTYALRIINEATGCFVNTSASIQKISPPVFTMTAVSSPQELCTPDGSIQVTDTQVDGVSEGGTGNFDFNWFRDDPANPPLADGSATVITADQIDNVNYPAIRRGKYYVMVTRKAGVGPGSGCSSAPKRVDIGDARIFPTVTLTPYSNTACDANYEGTITINASDSGGPGVGSLYTYDWIAGPGLVGTSINGNDGDGDGTDGDGDVPSNLADGAYQVLVTNETTSCSTSKSTSILKVTTPIIVASATPIDQSICAPDGSITVTDVKLDGISEPPADLPVEYTYSWTRDDSSNPALTDPFGTVIDGILLTTGTSAGEYSAMGAGTYYVTAKRNSGLQPGSGCESAPFRVEVKDVSIDPYLTLAPKANENCDLSFANGGITAVATTNGVQGPSYSFTVTSSTLVTPIDTLNTSATVQFPDLQPGDFEVQVVDDNTQCNFSRSVNIPNKPKYVDVTDVTFDITDQIICAPDGSIEVTNLDENGISQPLGDYDFVWYQGETNLNNDNPIGVIDYILDTSNYATIGSGTYFFKVIKNGTGSTDGGVGCESAPIRADIQDIHTDPNVDFNTLVNTSCDITNPNGQVLATAYENDGTDTDTYSFLWTYNGGALPGSIIQNDSVNISTLTNAPDGDYKLTVINSSRTQCSIEAGTTLNIDLNASEPNIIVVDVTDPSNCFPTGQLVVTEIRVGGQPANVNDFEYYWYDGDYTPGDIILDSLGNPINTAQLPDQYPGNYFVIARSFLTACESDPKEATISETDIRYPAIQIQELAPQTSCDSTKQNAALVSTVDGGNDDTNPNYQFQWHNSLDGTGPVFASTSTVYGLGADAYSVEVKDFSTNCSSVKYYITEDGVEDNRPVVNVASSPLTNCVIDDGSVSANVTNVPGSFEYNWYIGGAVKSIPDYTGTPVTGLPDGQYTVIAIEIDTTYCESNPATVTIKDDRVHPPVTITEDNPLTYCWSDDPNGQFSASVDGKVGGYTFEWFDGTDTTGTADFIGSTYIGLSAQTYTLVVTNNTTFCKTVESRDISDSTFLPPEPDPIVKSHLTSCIVLNGWVQASVDGNTVGYIFDWYNGTSVSGSPDMTAVNYRDLDAGEYTVTAQDMVTGCISEGATVEVLDLREFPDFDFNITPESCEQGDGAVEIVWNNNLPTESIIWTSLPSGTQIDEGSAIYNYPAGDYGVTVTTMYGCQVDKGVTIPIDIFEFNGVSANGDGRNDYFEIACITLFPNNNVKIYNRAGQLVYEINGYNNTDRNFTGIGENGLYPMGKELPDGTYFYIIDKGDGSEPIAGYLELIR